MPSAAGGTLTPKSDLTDSSLCDLLAYVFLAISSSVTGTSPSFGLSPYRTVLSSALLRKKVHFEKRHEEQRQRTDDEEDGGRCVQNILRCWHEVKVGLWTSCFH